MPFSESNQCHLALGPTTPARSRSHSRRARVLVERAGRYRAEWEARAWWIDELAWRRRPAAQNLRTPGVGQIVLPLAGDDVLSRHHHRPHLRINNPRAAARRLLNPTAASP